MRNLRVLAFALVFGRSRAAEAQSSEVVRLLREGVSHRVAGRDDLALERFVEAHARCRCAAARAQMGLAAQALGRFAVADEWLTEALAAQGDRWIEQNRAELQTARAAARTRIATLVVHAEAVATVRVDGEARGALSTEGRIQLRVDPGRRRVTLTTPDGRRAEESVDVLAGGESTLRVALPARAEPDPIRLHSNEIERPSAWRRVAPWVALAGAAGVVAGGVSLAFERRYTAIWEGPACLAGNRSREENCALWRESAERAEVAAVASWVAGGTLLALAAGLWWWAPRTTRALSLGCAPMAGVGVRCGGRF